MLTNEGLQFLLMVTNYFHGHWEDPGWGRRPMNQALIMLAIDELAKGITDEKVNASIHGMAEKSIINIAKQASSQDPIPTGPIR